MFDIGGGELLLILIVVLVAFGPKKLPELAQSLGRGIREFKRAQRDFAEQINSAIELEHQKQTRTVSRRPPNEIRPPSTPAIAEQQSMAAEQVVVPPVADPLPAQAAEEPRISPPVGERAARGPITSADPVRVPDPIRGSDPVRGPEGPEAPSQG